MNIDNFPDGTAEQPKNLIFIPSNFGPDMGKNIVLCLLSLVLLALPWLGLPGYTVLVAFVPLLTLQQKLFDEEQRSGRRKRIFWYVLPTFVLWTLWTVIWVKNAAWIGVIAAIVTNTFIYTLVFMVYHAVWRRAPRALAYTLLVSGWIAYELIYLNGQVSFPWLILGNGFANSLKAIQWYEFTGVLGGSLWVLVSNLLVYEAIKAWRVRKRIVSFVAPAIFIFIPIITSLILYATYKDGDQTVKVTTVQPNIDPYEKFSAGAQQQRLQILWNLILAAPREVDYVLTPETAVDANLWENTLEWNPLILDLQKFMGENFPSAELILGAETYYQYESDEKPNFTARYSEKGNYWWDYNNTALGIDSSSRIEIYHKACPLIGVEMLPYARFFKGLERFSLDMGGLVGQIGRTPRDTVFISDDGLATGVAICWDEVYGEYISKYVKNGARMLFIITNEGWWGDTRGYKQLFAYTRLRAIETRTAIGRSANTGISGFINGRGDVIDALGWDKRGVLTADIALNNGQTFYVRWGDWIGRLSGLVAALCLLYFGAYRIRKKDRIVE